MKKTSYCQMELSFEDAPVPEPAAPPRASVREQVRLFAAMLVQQCVAAVANATAEDARDYAALASDLPEICEITGVGFTLGERLASRVRRQLGVAS